MAVFKDAEEVYRYIGGFFQHARTHQDMGPKVKASGIVVRFEYSEPDSVITIDARHPEPGAFFNVVCGPSDVPAQVVMAMKADVAHRFWFGKLNLITALNRGEMKARGPIQAILKLLPAIKPAYTMYPAFLRQQGREDLIIP